MNQDERRKDYINIEEKMELLLLKFKEELKKEFAIKLVETIVFAGVGIVLVTLLGAFFKLIIK